MTLRFVSLAGALLVFVLGPRAAAQPREYESGQHFAIEAKFGPYSPNLDAEFTGGQTPFEDLFGSGTGLMFRGEVDVQVWRGFGSIGLGLVAGFFGISAATCPDTGSTDNPATLCSDKQRVQGDKTSLSMVPMAALAVYRFDVMAERWGIPLVPYVKAGPTYTLWWMRRGDGDVSAVITGSNEEQKGRGGVWGWQIDAGLAVRIDGLEPSAAQTLDGDYGINHTYLFVELLHGLSFGTPELGDTTVMGGLAFEF